MAGRIIWSDLSEHTVRDICSYWNLRNKSTAYSLKLIRKLDRAVETLIEFPLAGSELGLEGIRYLVVDAYQILYRVDSEAIIIITVWDTRQNPEKLAELLKQDR
jgi:toxin YoeB